MIDKMIDWLDQWESVLRFIGVSICIIVAMAAPAMHMNRIDKRHLEKEAIEKGLAYYNADKEFKWNEEPVNANTAKERGTQ